MKKEVRSLSRLSIAQGYIEREGIKTSYKGKQLLCGGMLGEKAMNL